VLGLLTSVAGFMFAHFTGLDALDNVGREIYPSIPRGWAWELAGQVVSLGGVLLAMAGLTLAFLYRRPLTWARASLGALLFTGLMMILYGIVPNEWLNLAQGPWEWTSAKVAFTIPSWLVLNNQIDVSFEAVKDIVLQGYIGAVTVGTIVVMYQWQERAKKRAAGPPPKPVSVYGRPVTKIGRS
jgi:hypothetical protein